MVFYSSVILYEETESEEKHKNVIFGGFPAFFLDQNFAKITYLPVFTYIKKISQIFSSYTISYAKSDPGNVYFEIFEKISGLEGSRFEAKFSKIIFMKFSGNISFINIMILSKLIA